MLLGVTKTKDDGHEHQNENEKECEGHDDGHHEEEEEGDSTEFYKMFDGMFIPHMKPILKQFDLSKYKTVCDLGGEFL